mmetsp:Transcript_10835/g.37976  ORF Transcript_10835/g.37976 Transcript_10835/m.37976 type:complete len:236 (-) Transcript_10835:4295-5002(-)
MGGRPTDPQLRRQLWLTRQGRWDCLLVAGRQWGTAATPRLRDPILGRAGNLVPPVRDQAAFPADLPRQTSPSRLPCFPWPSACCGKAWRTEAVHRIGCHFWNCLCRSRARARRSEPSWRPTAGTEAISAAGPLPGRPCSEIWRLLRRPRRWTLLLSMLRCPPRRTGKETMATSTGGRMSGSSPQGLTPLMMMGSAVAGGCRPVLASPVASFTAPSFSPRWSSPSWFSSWWRCGLA